ncbi:LacI family DNA-binding transcriptional regulator [Arthrobacter sp. AZCC_0090]|uniref:LacI family DNA-binding transcriptional regulator n=1 Tax=Arthrobacter sp. AZCC_0090 TaxID=2735881 RepID=UPI0017E6B23C|nr:substrate-binding domain-containing protein [Arthrobacter sp. AZCC_0090]MBB6406396.1 DNA-binding LacI/PurR family transcriptional regulator [Arthrobacter sp. AZCC_0090]
MADVAAAAGLSTPTVSKVLRGATDVSFATRERVVRIAQEMGYAKAKGPRPVGRSLAATPRLVDLVVSNIEGSWANSILAGVEEAAAVADCDVVLTIARAGRDWVSRLLRRPSTGAIVVLVDPTSTQLSALDTAGIPVVLVDPMSPAPRSAASVGVANWEGGRIAAEHLLSLGHKHFALIGGVKNHLYSRARLDGFRSALSATDLHVEPRLVGAGDWNRDEARDFAVDVLSREDRPTAIFAASDLMALGVYDAVRYLGLNIPGDVSVVGFDDIPEATWATPQLTTVRQPIQEMGATAFRMLLRLTNQREGIDATTEGPRVELATRLVTRGSTSLPRAQADT